MAKAGSDSSSDLRFEFISPLQQLDVRTGLKIEIRFGDIFESTADAIVVPEGTSFKHMGFVARHLTQIEPKYEDIRKRLVGKKKLFTPWEVYTEILGKRFQYVVCAIVPACDGDAEEWKHKFKLLYQRIFREADRKVISVLAVPLIGSGRGGASQEDAIEMAIASAFKFKGSHINKILFVSNDENTVALMASACRNTCGINPQSVTQARPQSSTHRSLSTGSSSSISKHCKESPKNGTNNSSSQARLGHTNVRSSVNSMASLEIDGKGFTHLDGDRGSKKSEKHIRASGRGGGDERNGSYGDHFIVPSDIKFVQQNSSSRWEDNKERNRGAQNIPRTYFAEADAYQQQDIKSCDAFHETEEEFVGTTRDQERQKGKEKHICRDKKSELTRVNNAVDDVGRYEDETYRNDVRMMNQIDRRSDVNRRNHSALHDDREGIVIGLQQKKIKKHIDNDGYDKYDDDESHHGDVHTDERHFHQSIDKNSQERKLYDNSGMDANRYDVMRGNGEVLVDRSVKSTGETFNLQATRNKGQKISENRVLGMDGQHADDKNIHPDQDTKKEINKSQYESDKQSCPICLEDMTDPKCLDKCGHVFCRDCIDDSFKHYKPVCPSCNMVYGVLTGNQPDGNMDVGFSGDYLPGYEGHGTITITYYFPSGIQGEEHPNPGQPYKGVSCRGYLPDCCEGRDILRLLKTAFDRKLTFTVGLSTTTGQENSVTWNGIEHKTDKERGTTGNRYPDHWYFVRVKQDLARNGIEGDESHGPVQMGTVNKQETTVSSSAVHGKYRGPATNATECLENLKKEAEKRNLVIRENEAIGDCMFISLSQQLEHVLNQHIKSMEIRRQLVKYLRENPTLQSQTQLSDFLVSETWEEYLDRMGRLGQWGDHIMLIAAANVYQVEIVVIWSTGQKTSIEPNIRHGIVPQLILGFISEKHYVSLEKNRGSRNNGRQSNVTTNAETVGVEETGQTVKQNSHALAEVKVPFPPSWTRMTANSELVTVSSGCQEYQDVGRRFLSSIGRGQHKTILEIKRVQSKTLWQLYCAKKQEIDSQDPGVQNERVLWHGTKMNSVLPISKNGFNRRFSGQNATVYGEGVYFASASRHAAEDIYSVPDDNGHKYVFQARVLTGTYAKGDRDMKVPPWRNEEQHLTYDSVVDNVTKPNLYVIFHDAQAYPEYLVTFT